MCITMHMGRNADSEKQEIGDLHIVDDNINPVLCRTFLGLGFSPKP